MCGIVGAIGERNVVPLLIDGLKRLEYRGYDSVGFAVIDDKEVMQRQRAPGKVSAFNPIYSGHIGIAHTRWATHGKPSEANAHPLMSGDHIAVVHNGIIENHEQLREQLEKQGYKFNSDTDTEVVAHLLDLCIKENPDFLTAVKKVVSQLEGAFALAFLCRNNSDRIIGVRRGSPLIIGEGVGEYFLASDHLAILPACRQFVALEEGDIVEIRLDGYDVYDAVGKKVQRRLYTSDLTHDMVERGEYRHFMLKEIMEQPHVVNETLMGRLGQQGVFPEAFGANAKDIFKDVKQVQIVACGTSYHAGMVARYWLEGIAGVPCQVEIASEFRYRKPVVQPNTLFVTLSQSGETADTLAALRVAKTMGYLATLTICNSPESALVRESDLVLLTRAGREIGVASTKAFTTQLVGLLLLTAVLGRYHKLDAKTEAELIHACNHLSSWIEQAIALDADIKNLAESFVAKHNALFLGRGAMYPIALEGALKLKELSYIHAEAYPAGELKHGPLALVDQDMPIIAVAPNDELLEKLKSNLQEVRARGGELIVFADSSANLKKGPGITIIDMPAGVSSFVAPIVYTIPLQLLSYHVAVLKGTDVDQPRNLAKSVTVE
jgi:glucosamine--fructose-6-phosphate aminotransferase (isomerizing)